MNEANTRANGRGEKPQPENSTTAHLASKAHEAVDRVASTAGHMEQSVREQAGKAASAARESEEQAMETVSDSARRARIYLKRNPMVAAGIAFGAGILVSALLRK